MTAQVGETVANTTERGGAGISYNASTSAQESASASSKPMIIKS